MKHLPVASQLQENLSLNSPAPPQHAFLKYPYEWIPIFKSLLECRKVSCYSFFWLFCSFHIFSHNFFTTQILLVSEMTIHPGFLETVCSLRTWSLHYLNQESPRQTRKSWLPCEKSKGRQYGWQSGKCLISSRCPRSVSTTWSTARVSQLVSQQSIQG